MDHLHIPDGCKPQAREVPHLGLAPSYDKLGFDGFPERHDLTLDELVSSDSLPAWRADYVESFIQEWLWFGLLDEFAKACKIALNLNDFITNSASGTGRIITTASIYDVYARRVAVRQLDIYAVTMGLDMGDLAQLRYEPSAEPVTQIIDFWLPKVQHSPPMTEERMARAAETLANIRLATDETGDAVPLDILRQRVVACRAVLDGIGANPFPRREGPSPARATLAESMARAHKALRLIMSQGKPTVRLDIVLSIDILCHTIAKIINVFLDETILLRSPRFTEKFEEIMIARNWCPNRISRIANAENTPLGYVCSLLPSYETSSHAGCRPRQCLLRPRTVESMTGLHRPYCEGHCPTVAVEESQLIEMWRTGAIPGIRKVHDADGEEVEVMDCKGQPFVAISHVWSHGLGNPSKNALPACQVRFLCGLARQVAGDDAILWIDTLSVPIEKSAKRIAISQLRTVYTDATKVLVLDRHLMRVGPDSMEQILQLLACEWQRRLWTLQEGRLARDLCIQFRDGAVPVSELARIAPLAEFRKSNADIFDFFFLAKSDVEGRFSKEQDAKTQFLNLVEDLSSRSATVKSDEPICLATMLGLDLEDFNPYPTMPDIYRSFREVPQDLIFLNQPRLRLPGLLWAPSTFLEIEYVSFAWGEASPSGRLSSDGLHVVKDCLLLDEALDFYRDPNSASEIYIIRASDDMTFAVASDNVVSADGSSVYVEPSRSIERPAVIWEKSGDRFGTTSKGVLVSRLHDEDGVTYCRFEMGLSGWRIGEQHQDFHQRMLRDLGKIIGEVSASFVIDKAFCVG